MLVILCVVYVAGRDDDDDDGNRIFCVIVIPGVACMARLLR